MTGSFPSSRGGPGFFPLSIKVHERAVLVVGGGKSALREVRRLIDFGANVDLVSPHIVADLQELSLVHGEHRINLQKRKFEISDEEHIAQRKYSLVFACTGDADQDQYIGRIALDADIPVCLPDSVEPAEATFVVPAIRKRGHVKIAVSTDGYCPALAKTLLERIEASLGGRIDKYVIFLDGLRQRMHQLDSELAGSETRRSAIMRRLGDSEELILAFQRENFDEASQLVEMIIAEVKQTAPL